MSASNSSIHVVNIVQFILGALIAILNLLTVGAIVLNKKLRCAGNLLLGNMFFANLVVGLILSVANVVDGTLIESNATSTSTTAIIKTEGTLALSNCYITVAMLLALITNKLMAIKSPNYHMSPRTCLRVSVACWAIVLLILLCKAIVSGLFFANVKSVCFDCFLTFEVVSLFIFTLATIVVYVVAQFLVVIHRKRTVHDGSQANHQVDYPKEYSMTLTAGIMLMIYTFCFILFMILDISWIRDNPRVETWNTYKPSLNAWDAEALITVYFVHCLLNPIVCTLRDKDLWQSMRGLMCCHRLPRSEQEVPPPGADRDAFALRPRPPAVPSAPLAERVGSPLGRIDHPGSPERAMEQGPPSRNQFDIIAQSPPIVAIQRQNGAELSSEKPGDKSEVVV